MHKLIRDMMTFIVRKMFYRLFSSLQADIISTKFSLGFGIFLISL